MAAERAVTFHIAVGIPRSIAAARMADLDEADLIFHEAAREQKFAPEGVGVLLADAIEAENVSGFV